MDRSGSVALAIFSLLASSSAAQVRALPHRLTILSEKEPAEERRLLEARFTCSLCDKENVQQIVQEEVRGLGYFKADVSDSVSTDSEEDGQRTIVDSVAINAGARYITGPISITGASALSKDALSKAVLLSPGAVFSAPLLGRSLDGIRSLYAKTRRMTVTVVPVLRIDEVNHVIALTLDISEN